MKQYLVNDKEQLEKYVITHWERINRYIDQEKEDLPIPFYSSIDIRESKFKFAPVDNNIYPAGFNNLCDQDLADSAEYFKKAILKFNPNAKVVGIIPESHTKNKMYLDHLVTLKKCITDAGFKTVILTFDETIFEGQHAIDLESHSKGPLRIEKSTLIDGKIHSQSNDTIDLCILNNDQSHPLPVNWRGITTPVFPSPHIGWTSRQKNHHFKYYAQVLEKFCDEFSINPNLLGASFRTVDGVDFATKDGLELVGKAIDELQAEVGNDKVIFIKASQGTYGMGIMVVKSSDEIINMNRKNRNKMDIGKNNLKFTSVLVQEGVETIIKYDDMPAEVTIYLIDGECVGGFMRANSEKDSVSNLNSKGMVFKKFCMCSLEGKQDHVAKEAIYATISRLSTIAAGLEIKDVN